MTSVWTALATAAPQAATDAAATGHKMVSEFDLKLPDFKSVSFLGLSGWHLLALGIGVCVLGLIFGLVIYRQLKNMPVHKSMREVSELIYETCKTYLQTQGKFILILELFIGAIIAVYLGVFEKQPIHKVGI